MGYEARHVFKALLAGHVLDAEAQRRRKLVDRPKEGTLAADGNHAARVSELRRIEVGADCLAILGLKGEELIRMPLAEQYEAIAKAGAGAADQP